MGYVSGVFQVCSRKVSICVGVFRNVSELISITEPSAKIMVVDDDPDVRDIVERCLVDAGYKVWTSGEGGTVLDTIKEQNINLAIVDLVLPDTDGLTL